jgi:hypothetical protein
LNPSATQRDSSTSRYEDCRLAGAAGIGLGAYAAFSFVLYWLMQPTVTANSGLAGYRPPPKTIVKYADAPWEPPNSPEALPIRAVDEPAPVIAKRSVTEEPKNETKKQEGRTTPRQARPVREQPNPFWGYASSRWFGSRPFHAMTDFDCRTRMAGMRPFVLSAEIASAYSQH